VNPIVTPVARADTTLSVACTVYPDVMQLNTVTLIPKLHVIVPVGNVIVEGTMNDNTIFPILSLHLLVNVIL
jgi:hypothetical protein